MKRSDVDAAKLPDLARIGDIVYRTHHDDGDLRLEILRADPLILITLDLCAQMLHDPNRWACIEVKNRHPTDCPDPMPAGHCDHPVKTATFSDDFGHQYVYEIGQHHNINGLEVFEARWPD